jgi:hypothetical protein
MPIFSGMQGHTRTTRKGKEQGVRMKAVCETMALNRVLSLSSRAQSQSANFSTEDAGSRFF